MNRSDRCFAGFPVFRMFVLPLRKWRNWQTHHLEGVALARAYGFKSRLPHIDRQHGPLIERPVVVYGVVTSG